MSDEAVYRTAPATWGLLTTSKVPQNFKTLPNDKYDDPKEVCGERKLFYRPLKK